MDSLNTTRKLATIYSMGIEWEIANLPSYIKRDTYLGFFYVVTDTSIREGRFSREFVSQPLPPSWLHKEVDKLAKKIVGGESNPSCGIHVHINREWCPEKRATRIAKTLSTFHDAQMLLLFGRVPNRYCVNAPPRGSRYSQVNITNDKTIEFRGFASCDVGDSWIHWCIDFIQFLVRTKGRFTYADCTLFRNQWLASRGLAS